MTATGIRLRLFAAASAAVGLDELTMDITDDPTIAGALRRLPTDDPDVSRVLARCSFLVNGIATTDRRTLLADGDGVDVMPPFAGG